MIARAVTSIAALAAAQATRLEAETANRAKDDFLAVLSHELRSPLNAMLGWLQIMKRPGADARLISRAVETIERKPVLRRRSSMISSTSLAFDPEGSSWSKGSST